MLGRTYDTQNCSAARALELVGERWSLLIIRDALFAGHARFGDFLAPVIVALSAWGDRYAAPNGPPIIYEHTACGSEIRQQIRCVACEEEICNTDIGVRPGPGLLSPVPSDDAAAGHR